MMRTMLVFAMMLFSALAEAEDRWMSVPHPPRMPEATESGRAKINGIDMYFANYGSATGTPILMIHGGLAHGDIWASQVI